MICMRVYIALMAVIIVFLSNISSAEMADKQLPFTAEEDNDGARSVWFFFNISSGLAGVKYSYIPAKDIPKSNRWRALHVNETLQPADIAWWANAVAILQDKEKGRYRFIFKNQLISLPELKKIYGNPVFRRFNKAEKPLALTIFNRNNNTSGRIPAILPKTKLYNTIFDLAINTRGARCTHDATKVVIRIEDTDEKKVYAIDVSGCITGEQRIVDPKFMKLIIKMEKVGAFK